MSEAEKRDILEDVAAFRMKAGMLRELTEISGFLNDAHGPESGTSLEARARQLNKYLSSPFDSFKRTYKAKALGDHKLQEYKTSACQEMLDESKREAGQGLRTVYDMIVVNEPLGSLTRRIKALGGAVVVVSKHPKGEKLEAFAAGVRERNPGAKIFVAPMTQETVNELYWKLGVSAETIEERQWGEDPEDPAEDPEPFAFVFKVLKAGAAPAEAATERPAESTVSPEILAIIEEDEKKKKPAK